VCPRSPRRPYRRRSGRPYFGGAARGARSATRSACPAGAIASVAGTTSESDSGSRPRDIPDCVRRARGPTGRPPGYANRSPRSSVPLQTDTPSGCASSPPETGSSRNGLTPTKARRRQRTCCSGTASGLRIRATLSSLRRRNAPHSKRRSSTFASSCPVRPRALRGNGSGVRRRDRARADAPRRRRRRRRGANFAGQMALALAEDGHGVHLVVRGGSLETSMAAYRRNRIALDPTIEVLPAGGTRWRYLGVKGASSRCRRSSGKSRDRSGPRGVERSGDGASVY
jgi:hypothetical protein